MRSTTLSTSLPSCSAVSGRLCKSAAQGGPPAAASVHLVRKTPQKLSGHTAFNPGAMLYSLDCASSALVAVGTPQICDRRRDALSYLGYRMRVPEHGLQPQRQQYKTGLSKKENYRVGKGQSSGTHWTWSSK
ncbi:uncharacterized protein K460DRAFT_160771 [Cucurbitaria berberidis CBS 394.84]|uniref:Uncharacterized protein n=1 Tax=Cucurbitaria berberidis CBS 394.84 TaxID=1168544 RepID=A0A9P4L6Q9_9PLEO|nr:uncharacterized protein K460DRAFT_160771 [Cucurbitaria berberidis CBS 394.84]KAF1844221.1 hypothetical protein K460DRAFT_160771 [Cucurbitaria berberidis CBS 394.84]